MDIQLCFGHGLRLILMFRHSSLLLFFVPWYEKSRKCKCADISPNRCKISLEVPCEIERQQRTVKRQQRTVVKGGKLREDGMRLFFDGFSTEGRSFWRKGSGSPHVGRRDAPSPQEILCLHATRRAQGSLSV